MDIKCIKDRIATNGGLEHLLYFQFNNSGVFYVWGDKEIFDPDRDLISQGTHEFILCRSKMNSVKNGMSTSDISTVTEKEVFTIEGMVFVDTHEHMRYIDRHDVRMC